MRLCFSLSFSLFLCKFDIGKGKREERRGEKRGETCSPKSDQSINSSFFLSFSSFLLKYSKKKPPPGYLDSSSSSFLFPRFFQVSEIESLNFSQRLRFNLLLNSRYEYISAQQSLPHSQPAILTIKSRSLS